MGISVSDVVRTLLVRVAAGKAFPFDVKVPNAAQKRGKDTTKLREVILLLAEVRPLPVRYKDHPLGGEWSHHRECPIEPDSVLNSRNHPRPAFVSAACLHSAPPN